MDVDALVGAPEVLADLFLVLTDDHAVHGQSLFLYGLCKRFQLHGSASLCSYTKIINQFSASDKHAFARLTSPICLFYNNQGYTDRLPSIRFGQGGLFSWNANPLT